MASYHPSSLLRLLATATYCGVHVEDHEHVEEGAVRRQKHARVRQRAWVRVRLRAHVRVGVRVGVGVRVRG